MNGNSDARYEKLMALSPQRRAKVEDFVDFLVRKEARAATLNRYSPSHRHSRLPACHA